MVEAIELSHFWNSGAVILRCDDSSASVGRPAVTTLELGERRLDLASPAAHRPRHPVERSQAIEDRATDARYGERLELDTAFGIEPLDGIDEAEHAGTDQVARVDAVGQAGADTAGDELDERRVVDDEAVAGDRIAGFQPALPPVIDVVVAFHARGWASV